MKTCSVKAAVSLASGET